MIDFMTKFAHGRDSNALAMAYTYGLCNTVKCVWPDKNIKETCLNFLKHYHNHRTPRKDENI